VSDPAPAGGRGFGRARDLGVGAAILLFCLVVWLITLTFKQAPPALAQNVQPASFPRLVTGVIAVLTVAMMVLGRATPPKRLAPIPAMVWLSAGVMVAFVLAFQWLGILPAMMLLCLGLPVLWGERRWSLIIPFGIGFPLAIYALFAMVLGVHFEPSPLAFW